MWRMFAHLRNGVPVDIGSRNYVVLQRAPYPIVEVEVAEVANDDARATRWGWLEKGRETPSMIWPTWDLFTMCFHSGPEVEVKAGHGRIVRLTVRPVGRLVIQ